MIKFFPALSVSLSIFSVLTILSHSVTSLELIFIYFVTIMPVPGPRFSAVVALALSLVAFVAEDRPRGSYFAVGLSGFLCTAFAFMYLITFSVFED